MSVIDRRQRSPPNSAVQLTRQIPVIHTSGRYPQSRIGVRLTEAGRAFQADASRILTDVDQARETAASVAFGLSGKQQDASDRQNTTRNTRTSMSLDAITLVLAQRHARDPRRPKRSFANRSRVVAANSKLGATPYRPNAVEP